MPVIQSRYRLGAFALRTAEDRLVTAGKRAADRPVHSLWQVCTVREDPCGSLQIGVPSERLRRSVVAFTLAELLVVVAVIALLIAFAFPALRATLESSRRATCAGNLKTLATAVLSYAGENNGRLPYAYANPADIKPGPTPWFWAVGGYISGQYTRAQEVGWINKKTFRALPSCLYCPSAKRETNNSTPYDISYGLNTQLTGRDPVTSPTPRKISSINRPGRMLLLADAMSYSEDGGHAWGVWPTGISRRHTTVANVAWLDGHVSRESISELATNTTYWDPKQN